MGYSGALKDISTSYDSSAVVLDKFGSNASSSAKPPVKFNNVFREKYAEGLENTQNTETVFDSISTFSAGSAQVLGTMAQIKDASVADDFAFLNDSEDLDSDISFDEIAELDDITDTVAAENAAVIANDPFGTTDVFDESEDIGDNDLSMFEDFEDIGNL